MRTVVGCVFASLLLKGDTFRLPSNENGAGGLYQVNYGSLWGYMSRSGQLVIPPAFEDEGDFSEGLAKVRRSGRWGYIDRRGSRIVPYRFQQAGNFRQGLAPVEMDGKWGFINARGEIVVKPTFESASDFSEGLARVEVIIGAPCESTPGVDHLDAPCSQLPSLYGFIDLSGHFVISAAFDYARDFSEGLAAVRKGGFWGFIDKRGGYTIKLQFDEARSFVAGLAAVEVGFRAEKGEKVAGVWGFIDKAGVFRVPAQFELVHDFAEQLASVSLADGRSGYINAKGKFVVSPMFSEAESFSDGLALVLLYEEGVTKYFIDGRGRRVEIRRQLQPQCSFFGGLSVAGESGNMMYFNKQGRIIAPYQSEGVSDRTSHPSETHPR